VLKTEPNSWRTRSRHGTAPMADGAACLTSAPPNVGHDGRRRALCEEAEEGCHPTDLEPETLCSSGNRECILVRRCDDFESTYYGIGGIVARHGSARYSLEGRKSERSWEESSGVRGRKNMQG
jgi:hypothetical protein